MHRMRYFVITVGMVLGALGLGPRPASAELLRPNAERAYPDIAADINGYVDYNYDESTETGVFTLVNTPYLIAGGPNASSEFSVNPTNNGIREQRLVLTLDKNGNIVEDGLNSYEMIGKIKANGKVYQDILLRGKATEFGFLDLDALLPTPTTSASASATATGLGVDIFDLELEITRGKLSEFFGDTAYLRITPELESTFAGVFDEDFSAQKATSNTRAYDGVEPFPIPEPTAIAVLVVGALGVFYRRHLRRPQSDH